MSKILFVSNLFPSAKEPHRGLFNVALLSALRAVGSGQADDLRVLVPVAKRWGASEDSLAGAVVPELGGEWADAVRYVPYLHIPLLGRNLAGLFCSLALRKHLGWFRDADIVVGSWLYPDGAAAWGLAREAGKRFVARLHGTDRFHLDATLRGRRCRACLRDADAVLVNAVFMQQELEKRGIGGSQVVVNGVDDGLFYVNAAEAREDGAVLWAGNLVGMKDPARAIRVFRAASGMGAKKLWLVGAGPLLPVLRRQVAAYGLEQAVDFIGSIEPDKLAGYMRRAHCLLLTSRSEGMPNVVQEALACGTPVVSTRVGDVPQIIRDGCNGYCLTSPRASDAALCEALGQALTRTWDAAEVRRSSQLKSWQEAASDFLAAVAGGED